MSCFLTVALLSVRERPNRFNPPVSSLGLPQEMEYADDVNFLVEENKPLDHLLYVAADKPKVHNCFGELDEYIPCRNHRGRMLWQGSPWRKNKSLGCLLCCTTDITARCIQGKVTLESVNQDPSEDKMSSLQCILRINHALQLQYGQR